MIRRHPCVLGVLSAEVGIGTKDLQGNRKDRSGPKLVRGRENVFKNIFWSGWVEDFHFSPVQVASGYLLRGIRYFFPRILRINLELNGNHASHSQTE